MAAPADNFSPLDTFVRRHLGSSEAQQASMLATIGVPTVKALLEQTLPADIRLQEPLELRGLPTERFLGEQELLHRLADIAAKNQKMRSFLGMGYHDCLVPGVIQRNILENPGWYTQYTPYQAEIAQGRLEALLNFQTVVADLTGLPMANASLLDEGTAAAEAMGMARALGRNRGAQFFVSQQCHPQTIAVVQTRASALGITVRVGDEHDIQGQGNDMFGMLLQYPGTDGRLVDYRAIIDAAHTAGALVVVATDLLALTLLRPPGEFGADIAIGTSQRFGIPLGYGGPHAAFLATSDSYKRQLPGRVIGVSKDAQGKMALRMAMQTREQHIRREKATSNICTAQALLAIMASMYAVYHGPRGLKAIATRVHLLAQTLAQGLRQRGMTVVHEHFFDTLLVRCNAAEVVARGHRAAINLRLFDAHTVGVALDEATEVEHLQALWEIFSPNQPNSSPAVAPMADSAIPPSHVRSTTYLEHAVFNSYHSEHEMLRYINRLRSRDLSLTHSMIALGSCTMKLNATSEMVPVSWPEFAGLHPFAPKEQAAGYAQLFADLESWLCAITGFAGVSLQPNAGAQGEYTGLMVIRAYHHARQQTARNVCLIPVSAHGTNPASATMAGFVVVPVGCAPNGNIDLDDLQRKAALHGDRLGALMVTYPSTHGVFEPGIRDICRIVHDHGGQVYLDGANMNAQVALCRPGDYGADVCHLNLHKTFCIPHGGGGPGMGPIGVAAHLTPFLPGHPLVATGGEKAIGPVSAAPWGSAGILPIPWVYIALMGAEGLRQATSLAILNANYMATRLQAHYTILYRGAHGRVAHEFILDLRPFKTTAGIEAEDVAKRLIDYGFHAPTMSFPVAGTLMVEPTESESKAELDRFCDAMIAIRQEIDKIERGLLPRDNNMLKHAPHPAEVVASTVWDHPYSREEAVFPNPWAQASKFWPPVGRIDNAYGDRNLVCTCPPMETYT